MSKAKVSDVRQGVTLFYVHAFPHKGIKSFIDTILPTDRPKMNDTGLFGECLQFYKDDSSEGSYKRPWSLRDAGIVPNGYNFHKTFTSRKAARRYADRMDRCCLTASEQTKYLRKISEEVFFQYD